MQPSPTRLPRSMTAIWQPAAHTLIHRPRTLAPTPKPASLGTNQPLLTAPPSTGAQLVPLLRQAVAQSGLFYESHQAEWVLGDDGGRY